MARTIGTVSFLGTTVVTLTLHIAAVAIASKYSDAAAELCVTNGISFSLAAWMLYGGIVGIVAQTFLITLLVVSLVEVVSAGACHKSGQNAKVSACCLGCATCNLVCLVCTLLPLALFGIAWFITGIVLIASVPEACRTDVPSVFVMAIVVLVFQGLWILNGCFARPSPKQDE